MLVDEELDSAVSLEDVVDKDVAVVGTERVDDEADPLVLEDDEGSEEHMPYAGWQPAPQ